MCKRNYKTFTFLTATVHLNWTPCLYAHFARAYVAISAQRFKLNFKYAHFPELLLLCVGIFMLLTPSIMCVCSYTFLPISLNV